MDKSHHTKFGRDVLRACKMAVCSALLAVQLVSVSVSVASAQGQTIKDLVVALERRSDALEYIGSLERIAARIVYIESVALLAHYGEWPGEGDAAWQGDASSDQVSKFFYDVNNIYHRFRPEIVSLRRNANRTAVFTDEELNRFTRLIDELEQLISGSQMYYEFLKAGEIDAANDYFREDIRTHYFNITAGSYTITSGVLRDIDIISRLARSTE